MEPIAQTKGKANPASAELVLAGIACSHWSQSQREAVIMLLFGEAEFTEHFVPLLWNRPGRARSELRELEKAGHLCRDGGRWYVIESSFARPALDKVPQQSLAMKGLPEEPGLGAALCEIEKVAESPRPDRGGAPCPPTVGRSAPTGAGHEPCADPPTSYLVPQRGRTRSSNRSKLFIDRFDDRSCPARGADSATGDLHRETALERLAKNSRLASLRAEILRRKTPTAMRFWCLIDKRPYRAAQLIAEVADKRNPAAYLNRALQHEEGK